MKKTFSFVHGIILFSAAFITVMVFQLVAADTDVETASGFAKLPNFADPINITSGSKESVQPAIAVAPNGSSLLVAYSLEQSSTNHDIYVRKLTQNGTNLNPASEVYNSTADSTGVDVTYDASTNRGHVVWVEEPIGNPPHLYYARENANGSWSVTSDLEPVVGVNQEVLIISDPKIFASGSQTLDIVWLQQNINVPSISGDIYHARSENRGSVWYGKVPIENNDNITASLPDLYVNGNTIHAVWQEQRQGRYSRKIYCLFTRNLEHKPSLPVGQPPSIFPILMQVPHSSLKRHESAKTMEHSMSSSLKKHLMQGQQTKKNNMFIK